MPGKAGKPKGRPSVKLTVPIDVELDTRLYGLAKSLGCGKAELAARLIDQGLRRYGEDRRLRVIAAELGEQGRGEDAA